MPELLIERPSGHVGLVRIDRAERHKALSVFPCALTPRVADVLGQTKFDHHTKEN